MLFVLFKGLYVVCVDFIYFWCEKWIGVVENLLFLRNIMNGSGNLMWFFWFILKFGYIDECELIL